MTNADKKNIPEQDKNKSKSNAWIKPVIGITVILIMILFQSGKFSGTKIQKGRKDIPMVPPGTKTVKAAVLEVERIFEQPGIVTTRQKADLSPMVMGVIKEVHVVPGDNVSEDQLLMKIDSEPFEAKLDQAHSGKKQAESAKAQSVQQLSGAQAGFEQAKSHFTRVRNLFEKEAATKVMLEDAESKYKQTMAMLNLAREGIKGAEAKVTEAEKTVKEAMIALSYTEIRAPFSGKITRKYAEPGDLAVQGKPLFTINNETSMLLEAQLSEKFRTAVSLGDRIRLNVGSIDYNGRIAEIIPSVDPSTRTFTVKASFEPKENVFVGTYGKLMVPSGTEKIVAAPLSSITRIGQLQTVLVKKNEKVLRKYVRLGRYKKDNLVEVLSGLSGDEELFLSGN